MNITLNITALLLASCISLSTVAEETVKKIAIINFSELKAEEKLRFEPINIYSSIDNKGRFIEVHTTLKNRYVVTVKEGNKLLSKWDIEAEKPEHLGLLTIIENKKGEYGILNDMETVNLIFKSGNRIYLKPKESIDIELNILQRQTIDNEDLFIF